MDSHLKGSGAPKIPTGAPGPGPTEQSMRALEFGWPEVVFRTNWTEIFGGVQQSQCQLGNAKPRCAEFQMNAVECLEAYGAKRGRRLCTAFIDDYMECLHGFMQIQRVNEMTKQRLKQVMRGERSLDNYHDKVKPPRDALQFGPFHP